MANGVCAEITAVVRESARLASRMANSYCYPDCHFFPPLFGHEIIALLCGVVYGLWIGFAIVAAGTFIGEGKPHQIHNSVCIHTNIHLSWHMVRLQILLPLQGSEIGAHELELWRYGTSNT